jgi:hypothetical protein
MLTQAAGVNLSIVVLIYGSYVSKSMGTETGFLNGIGNYELLQCGNCSLLISYLCGIDNCTHVRGS